MKRTFLALAIIGLGFASCKKEQQPMSKAEIKQKIDSLTAVRVKESDAQAQLDLQHRISIEVKVKADSIANVLTKKANDTTVKAKPVHLQPRLHALGGI